MKFTHFFWILLVFKTNVVFAQYSETTMEDVYSEYYSAYSSKELVKAKEWFKTYNSYFQIQPNELATIIDVIGPNLYKMSHEQLLDALLNHYAKDVQRNNLSMEIAMKAVWNAKDIPKGRWPVDQAWDYATHIDCDFSEGAYTRSGWSKKEEQLYQRVLHYQDPKDASGSYRDAMWEDINKTIDDHSLRLEFLLLFAKKISLERLNFRCKYLLEEIAKQVHESDRIAGHKRAAYFLVIAKISTQIFDESPTSAKYLSSARQYISSRKVHQLHDYMIIKSFFNYEQQGFKGYKLALIDNHKHVDFLRDINTPESHQYLDEIENYPFAWHYSEAHHRFMNAWYNWLRLPRHSGSTLPFTASAVHLVLAEKSNPRVSNRLLINNLAIMLAEYRNNVRIKEKLFLESAELLRKHPSIYATSDKYRLFVSLIRHHADRSNQTLFNYLQTIDQKVSAQKEVELFSFPMMVYQSPSSLSKEDAETKYRHIKARYGDPGSHTRFLVDPLHDYIKDQKVSRLLDEIMDMELKSMTNRLSGLPFNKMGFIENEEFEAYLTGVAWSEGLNEPDKMLLNKEVEDLHVVLSETTKETRGAKIDLIKANKQLALTKEQVSELKNSEIELLQSISVLESRREELEKDFKGLDTNFKKLENDYGTLEEQKAKTDRNLVIAIVVGIIAVALALLAFRLWAKASRARSRAQESEIREKASAFALSQIGHLAPECIHKVREKVQKDGLEYSLLGRLALFLEKVYGIYTRKETTLSEESNLINQFVSLKYTPLANKTEESSHVKIKYSSLDEVDPNSPIPMFALLNVVANSFRHGDLMEPDRYESSDGMVDIAIKKEGDSTHVTVANYKKKHQVVAKEGKDSTGLVYLKDLLASWNGEVNPSQNPHVQETEDKYTISYAYKYREAAV